MLKRNKKNVLIGVCALAGVALTSVGFATWVVGVQQKNVEVKLSTEVDSVASDTVFLTASLGTTKLKIAENEAVDKTANKNYIVGTKDIATAKDGLKFSFSDITIQIGEKAFAESKPTKLKLSLKDSDINKVKTENVKFTEAFMSGKRSKGAEKTNYTYLALSKEIPLNFDDSEGSGINMVKQDITGKPYLTYKMVGTDLNQAFSWGTLFNNTEPSKFYNNLYTGDQTLDTLLDGSEKAFGEIDAMNKVFSDTGASLTISVSIE